MYNKTNRDPKGHNEIEVECVMIGHGLVEAAGVMYHDSGTATLRENMY